MPYPTKRTPEIEAEVLERMSAGEPLEHIAPSLGITPQIWRYWCRHDEVLDDAHGRARDAGFDALAAQCLEIADTPCTGIEKLTKADGSVEVREGDMLGHRKLRIETRLKLLACWDPRRYGDKATLSVNGSVSLLQAITKSREIDGTATVVDVSAGKGEGQ